jgi:predicted amidohydrolase YtcJ
LAKDMKHLFYNGNVITMDPTGRVADAILIEGNTISDVGSYHSLKPEADSKTIKIDLKGKTLLPGFIDNHTHLGEWMKRKTSANLESALCCDDVRKIFVKYRKKLKIHSEPQNCWLIGYGLHKHKLSDYNLINRKFLDSISPDLPLVLATFDLHTKCCNSIALKIAGITNQSSDPHGGSVGRFADGSPNGFLYEKACSLINDYLPQAQDISEANELFTSALEELYSYGLTGVHSMENYRSYLKSQDDLRDKLRICWHIYHEDKGDVIANGHRSYTGDEFSKFGTIKLFIDGALGSESAYISRPYTNNKDNYGYPIIYKEELTKILEDLFSNRLAVSVHSIGDSSTEIFLNSFEEIRNNKKIEIPSGNRLEHLQFLSKDQIARIASLNLYCSLQPVHLSFDIPVIKELCSPDLHPMAYPFSTLLKNKCRLGFGSDAPIADINPFQGIYYALTRADSSSPENKGWFAEESLNSIQAIAGYTIGGAEGALSNHRLGSLERGKLADLIVLEDFENKPAEYWKDAKSLLTMIDGKIVYSQL